MTLSSDPTDYWRLGGIVLDAHDGPEPTITPGESYDCHTVTTTRSDAPGKGAVERYTALLAYGATAGQYDLHDFGGGTVGYTETHNGRAPSGTLVVGLRPPADTTIGRGGWFLVDSVSDLTPLTTYPSLMIEMTYLAPLARTDADRGYNSQTALAHNLEADPL